MKIEIYPLEKVEINGVPIFFGMEKTAVEASFGRGEVIRGRSYYHRNEMAVEYGSDSRVTFIEFIGGPRVVLKPLIYGVSVFDTPSAELSRLLAEKNGAPAELAQEGYFGLYRNIGIAVHRERCPNDLLELAHQQKQNGIQSQSDEYQRAWQTANRWSSIGAASPAYYRTWG